MKKEKNKLLNTLLIIILSVLIIMQINVIPLKIRVKETARGTIDYESIKGQRIERFYRKNWDDFCGGFVSGDIKFKLFFCIHGFKKGVIFTYYDWIVRFGDGKRGGWKTFSTWYIELIDGQWQIVRIIEPA